MVGERKIPLRCVIRLRLLRSRILIYCKEKISDTNLKIFFTLIERYQPKFYLAKFSRGYGTSRWVKFHPTQPKWKLELARRKLRGDSKVFSLAVLLYVRECHETSDVSSDTGRIQLNRLQVNAARSAARDGDTDWLWLLNNDNTRRWGDIEQSADNT